jgi:hypothetical protein
MKRLLLVPIFGLAVSGLASPAQAQLGGLLDGDRLNYSAEARQPYYAARRIAYDNGYREGLKEGEKDGRRRDAYEFRDEGAWRNGDKGYNRSFGDRDRYRVTFRTGFEAGYADAYRRYAPTYGYGSGRAVPRTRPPYSTYPNRGPGVYYPGQPGYGSGYGYSPAFSNGSQDGYEKGREDVRDGDRYDPARHSWYRSGDRHYRNEYGSRDRYRDEYRQGFQEGYDRAFRDYGYRR